MPRITLNLTRKEKENRPKIILNVNRMVSGNSSGDSSSDSLANTTLQDIGQIINQDRVVTRSALKKVNMRKQLRKTTGLGDMWTEEKILEWCSDESVTSEKACEVEAEKNTRVRGHGRVRKGKKGNHNAKIGRFRFCTAIWAYRLRREGDAKEVQVVPARWIKVQQKDCILPGSKEEPRLFATHKTYVEEREEIRTFMFSARQF